MYVITQDHENVDLKPTTANLVHDESSGLVYNLVPDKSSGLICSLVCKESSGLICPANGPQARSTCERDSSPG